ncbi:MAG TPA: ADP-ribose pyrophosphatase [Clostridiales bacterium]|nr:ADP-ribose pyrophosphatase [Clostridiales bacterium]
MNSLLTEKTLQTEKCFDGRVFQVEVLTVEMPDGRPARREIVRHGGGACVVALDENQRIYLVRQYRKPYDDVLLEIPAGKLETGEEPAACAARELAEETGLRAANMERLAVIYPSPGYCSETLSIYLATGLVQGESCLDDGENLHCQSYPLEEVLAMIDRGEIHDAKTLVALLTISRRMGGSDSRAEGQVN